MTLNLFQKCKVGFIVKIQWRLFTAVSEKEKKKIIISIDADNALNKKFTSDD